METRQKQNTIRTVLRYYLPMSGKTLLCTTPGGRDTNTLVGRLREVFKGEHGDIFFVFVKEQPDIPMEKTMVVQTGEGLALHAIGQICTALRGTPQTRKLVLENLLNVCVDICDGINLRTWNGVIGEYNEHLPVALYEPPTLEEIQEALGFGI